MNIEASYNIFSWLKSLDTVHFMRGERDWKRTESCRPASAIQKFGRGIAGQQDKYIQNWQHVRFLKDSIRAKCWVVYLEISPVLKGVGCWTLAYKRAFVWEGTAVQLPLFCISWLKKNIPYSYSIAPADSIFFKAVFKQFFM